MIPTEYQEQCKIFEWCNLNISTYPQLEFIFSTLNGIRLPIGLAVKAKRNGLKKGVPDIIFPFNNKHYNGLYIELKRVKGGIVSNEQKRFLNYLNSQGYLAVICKGADEALSQIKFYLQEEKNDNRTTIRRNKKNITTSKSKY